MSYWLLPLTIPTLVQGYLVGLLSLMVGISKRPRFDGPVLTTEWRDWFGDRWGYSTTIGAWMGKAHWFNEWTQFHEEIHLKQYEDLNVLGAVLGAALIPWIGWQGALIVWGTSGAPWILPNFLTALIRNKRKGVSWLGAVYYGSEHERSAYAQTKRAREYNK